MKNDKLILFDWGNIVESHQTGYTCYNGWNDLIEACGYKYKEDTILKEIKKYKICSIKSIEEFKETYKMMQEEFSLNKSFDEFVKLHKEITDKIDYYKDVSDYEKSLKDKCKIGIFSNLTIFDKERLDKQVDLSKYDYVFLSYEYGFQKPEIEIYKIVQEKVGVKPEDILFIDDAEKNINTAKEMGWNTLQITGLQLDVIKEECEKFLNK